MKIQALLAIPLATLAASTALPARRSSNPSVCLHARGIYDVCDTQHSFVRCNGHEAILVADCKLDASSYCQIINGKGRCDGAAPPDLAGEAPSCEVTPPPDSSISEGSTRVEHLEGDRVDGLGS
ncbi:hypothetical protein F4803DRAFT_552992 [Xylaria telfairii]|nr:hypothetical protein F4803DRAFT_552992 [Xylaria telfairii]